MQDLLLLMGKILPEESIIEEIKNSSAEWMLTKSDESKNKLQMYCMLLLTKEAIGDKDIAVMSKQLEQSKRIAERLNSENA